MVPPRTAWPGAPTSTSVGLGISVASAEVANGVSAGEASMSSVNGLSFRNSAGLDQQRLLR